MDTSYFYISEDVPRAPHQPGPGFKFPKRSFGKKTVLPPVPLLPLQRGPLFIAINTHAYTLRTCKYGAREYESVNTFRRNTDADVVPANWGEP